VKALVVTQEKITRALMLGFLCSLLVIPSSFSAQSGSALKNLPIADVPDDPVLPRVLLIGDSIAHGYTEATRRLLQGRANVHLMIPVTGGYDTERGLRSLDASLGKGKWDVIHFNWGLHDLTVLLGQGGVKNDGTHLVPLDRYQSNLEELVNYHTRSRGKRCSTVSPEQGRHCVQCRRSEDHRGEPNRYRRSLCVCLTSAEEHPEGK